MRYICLERKNLMKKLAAVFVIATLLLNVTAPTLAHAAIHLQGAEVNANTLIQDAYVAVIYCDSNDEQQVYKGWIDAIGETAFTLRSRALFGKKTIAYDKVLSVIMSEGATTRVKHEVDRLIPEMEQTRSKNARDSAGGSKAQSKDGMGHVRGPD